MYLEEQDNINEVNESFYTFNVEGYLNIPQTTIVDTVVVGSSVVKSGGQK